MNSIRSIREVLAQEFSSVIGLGNDYTRSIDKFVQTDLELARRENVVGMGGKAESDWEKSADPKSGARGHPSEVCVNVTNPHFSQAQSDINRLIETEKIGAAAPLIESADNFCRYLSFFRSAADLAQQLLLIRQVMHALNDALVPVLRRFIFRIPDGENQRSNALSSKLSNFSIAKRLPE